MSTRFSRNQLFALASAGIYLAVGLAGFVVTGFGDFVGDTDDRLIIFGINPLHNVVHLVLGAVWLAGASSAAAARTVNIALGAGLLVAFVIGMVGAGGFLNIDDAAEPDNYLHLAYGLISLGVGLKVHDDVIAEHGLAA